MLDPQTTPTFTIGRERVSNLPLDHPSCSKQHATLTFKKQGNANVYVLAYSRVSICNSQFVYPIIPSSRAFSYTFPHHNPYYKPALTFCALHFRIFTFPRSLFRACISVRLVSHSITSPLPLVTCLTNGQLGRNLLI